MSDKDVIKEAQEAFQEVEEAESENRRLGREDVRFGRLDDQWTDQERRDRDLDGRPCLTINKLPASMRQVYNDARQNRPAIVVHPVDGGADPETAEVLNGIIRNIEQSSDAESAYDTALEHAVDRGRGVFQIDLEYARDDTFEQDVVIKRIANPWSVYGDPASTAVDSSDWDTAFVLDRLSETAFKRRFKDAELSSFTDSADMRSDQTDEGVIIAAWWTRETVERSIVLLSDGQIVPLDEFKANLAIYQQTGVTVVGEPRKVPSYKVKQRLLSGAGVLETVDWAGRYIPIIPVYGEEVNEDGKRHWRSLIRGAKDAQRRYNVHMSEATAQTLTSTKAPWVGAKGSFNTDAKRWATSNEYHAYLEYDPVNVPGGGLAPPPQRSFPGAAGAAEAQAAMIASEDMKAIMGIHDASLGAPSNETSGRAIMARQREGDISTYHFPDNLNRAIRHAGRVLVDLIPRVYAIPRVQRILGPDGKASMVPINQRFEQEVRGPNGQVEKISRIYDLGTGRYDVTVKAGPSFTSRREEAATQMIELIRAYPDAAPIIGDLLASNLDWPGADEIADRLRKMLPAQLQGESPEAQQAQAEMQKLAELVKQLQAQLEQAKSDQAIKAQEAEIKAFEAQTDRLKVEGELALQARDQEIARLRALVEQLSGGTIQAAA